MSFRINIVGAAGAGTTTLGKSLSSALCCNHFEADDILWLPSDPPYQKMRPPEAKNQMAYDILGCQNSFVLSGSIAGWENRVVELLTHVIYLDVPTEVRLSRLVARETKRFGKIDPKFYEWAAQYDEGRLPGRSRRKHKDWLSSLTCAVIELIDEEAINVSSADIVSKLP